MLYSIITILAGAVAGALCKFACDTIIKYLLKKREAEYSESKAERFFLFAVMAVIGGLIAYLVPFSAEIVFFYLLLIICEPIAVIDTHTRLIPNDLILAVFGLTVIFGIPGLLGASGWPEWKLVSALVGMVVCFVIFTLPAALSKQVGAGDIKLAAAMGFCMGLWNSLFAIILMGILVLGYTVMQSKLPVLKFISSAIPMGPFLSAAMIAVLLSMKLPIFGGLFAGMPF